MTGVDADLATLRQLVPHSSALTRVEAELSRLREQLDREREAFVDTILKHNEYEEARCARLQQALAWYADENNWTQLASWGGRLYDDEAPGPRDCGKIAREALAGLDAEVAQRPVMTPPASGGRAKEQGERPRSRLGTPPSASNPAGRDMPADVCGKDGWHYFEDGLTTCRCGRLATNPEPREGIVMVYDWQHRYLGCMGVDRWRKLVLADSQEDKT